MSLLAWIRSHALALALLAAAAFVVYGFSLQNEFVIWDDDTLVFDNPLTQHFTWRNILGAFTSYDPELYIPLTILSFQVEHLFFGFAPFFYHLDNLLLHILNAALVLALLERLGLRRSIAFLAALVFAVHPLNTEAVAWVSARKDLLATFFSLGAMIRYLQWKEAPVRRWPWDALTLFLCALMSKPVAIVLPGALLLIGWRESGRVTRQELKQIVPFLLLSAVFLIVGIYGKRHNIDALTISETLLLAGKSTLFSVMTFFWPSDLSIIYLQTDPIILGSRQFWVPIMIIAIVAMLTIWSLRRTRTIIFGAAFFLIFLVPSFSNFAKDDIYYFSDRYIYMAQIGILFALGAGLEHALRTLSGKHRTAILAALSLPLLLLLSGTAYARSRFWHDSETLYRDALTKNDRSVVMHYNLGVLAHRRENLEEAQAEYEKALALNPRYAKALNNLGVLLRQRGDFTKALELLRLAADASPDFPDPHSNIGSILMDQGKIDAAIAEFHTAIAISETFAQAHINLASALGRKGLYEEGLREYKRAFALAPQLLDDMPEIRKALENLTP